MKKIFFFAVIALVAAGCAKTEIEAPAQTERRTIALSATLPADESDARMTYTPDGTTLKWSAGDTLMLCFVHGANYHHNKAPIVPASISVDGKKASFTVTVPEEIPSGAAFTFHAVYQQTSTYSPTNGGYFEAGTAKYVFENFEEECITLDKPTTDEDKSGIIRPALCHTQTNATATTLNNISFRHLGWVMALHLKNSSITDLNLPTNLRMQYENESPSSFIWNGCHNNNTVTFDLSSNTVSSSTANWRDKASVYFGINEYDWQPLYNSTLAAGASITLYRWLIGTPDIEPMRGYISFSGNEVRTATLFPSRTKVQPGKVYHVYMKWNGTTLEWESNS